MKLELPQFKFDIPKIDEKAMMDILDQAYETTINGIPGQKTIEELATDYLKPNNTEVSISKMITYQTSKAALLGFVTGFGGVLTMPITIPANITSVILVQMRMIATIAYMRGYDLHSDQVQTFVYASLTGTSVTDIAKKAGIVIANKLATGVIKKIPGEILKKSIELWDSDQLQNLAVQQPLIQQKWFLLLELQWEMLLDLFDNYFISKLIIPQINSARSSNLFLRLR